ncbi:MAG: polysaccharide deacetylase family protein [Chitinophagaceae bacterium]
MISNSSVTTSWDDGHPLDFRIAELLNKYNMGGTFYIPKNNLENPVMNEEMVVRLSKHFEIGGHTMNHTPVNRVNPNKWEEEVADCYEWLTDLTGEAPISFCFPRGKYNAVAAAAVFRSGFKIARTTEILSYANPHGLTIIPTTIQIYEHSRLTYLIHLLKRKKVANLIFWIKNNSERDLEKMVDKYLSEIIATKGCLHIWGHSWEIDNHNLWNKLEAVLKRIAGIDEIDYVPNKCLAGISQPKYSALSI